MIELLLLAAIAGLMHAVGGVARGAATGGTELALGYLLLVAFLGGRVMTRLGLPKLTGYLLAGILSGPFVFGLVTNDMTGSLEVVDNLAAAVLGLVAGGRLDLKRVRPTGDTLRSITVFGIAPAMVLLPALLFAMRPLLPMFAGLSLEDSVLACLLVGVTLAAQSPAVVMALLSETRADGPLSQMILATVVVADLVVVVVYSVLAVIAHGVLGGGFSVDSVFGASWGLVGSMGFGVIVAMLIASCVRHVPRGAATFAVVACLAVATCAGRLHFDPLIVTIATGVYLTNFSRIDARKLLRHFEAAELPVFVAFFALAGCKLDLGGLWAAIVPVVAIAATRACVFFVGCRAACARTRADDVVAHHAWTGLVPQAGLALAFVVTIQRDFPTFGPAAAVLLLSVVGLNQLIAPVLLRISLVRSREVGKQSSAEPVAGHA